MSLRRRLDFSVVTTVAARYVTPTSLRTERLDLQCTHAACTELHLGGRGIERIRGFEHFTNLECLWLNNNKLRAITNLDANFRIRELYVQGNQICTLRGSLQHFKFLLLLDISNNELDNLRQVTAALSRFDFLENLRLSGNPCCQETGYRDAVVGSILSLKILDNHGVTRGEREALRVRKIDADLRCFCHCNWSNLSACAWTCAAQRMQSTDRV